MAEKENMLRALPVESTSLASLVNEDCISFYPSTKFTNSKGSNCTETESSHYENEKDNASENHFQSPKSTLKRSKHVDPSQRPTSLKRSKPEAVKKNMLNENHKRPIYELESDYLDGHCQLKPKRLKFNEELNNSFDNSDVYDAACSSNAYDEELQNDFERGECQEFPLSDIEEELANGQFSRNEHRFIGLKGLIGSTSLTGTECFNEEECPKFLEETEIDSSQNECTSSSVQHGNTSSQKGPYKKIQKEKLLPPMQRKGRYEMAREEFTVTSSRIGDETSENENLENVIWSQTDNDVQYAERFDQSSSPVAPGPRKRLFSSQLHSDASISFSPINCTPNQSRASRNEVCIQDRVLSMSAASSPITGQFDKRKNSKSLRRPLLPLLNNCDPPCSTSTPRRSSHLPSSQIYPDQVGPGGDIRLDPERIGPCLDTGLSLVSDALENEDLVDIDLLERDEDGIGMQSQVGYETQPSSSQGLNSSQIVSPSMALGEFERSTIIYPETSSEPDRNNMSGDASSFLGLEPIYQYSSMYHGINNSGNRRYSNVRSQRAHGSSQNVRATPPARRHLNFAPISPVDQIVPKSVMDPED